MSSQGDLTVDQLAARVGMTVRNVRAHQSRGLLPPPVVRGRTGYYGPEHIARLELITEMQAEGFNLRAIRHTLDRLPPGGAAEFLTFRREMLEPWSGEEPEVLTRGQLSELIGTDDEMLLERAIENGFLRPLGDDTFEAPSPALLRAGANVVGLGIPPVALLSVLHALHSASQSVADEYVGLFVEHVWRPYAAAGEPPEEFAAVRDALGQLVPLASQALLASFRLAMQEASARAFEAETAAAADADRAGA